MSLNLRKPQPKSPTAKISKRLVSLSTFFPKGTQYFYGYPAGEDSGFLNLVTPAVEELVAARALICAGNHVSVVSFAATHAPHIRKTLLEEFDIPQLDPSQLIVLPPDINASIEGEKRNRVIKKSLIGTVLPKSFVMAQPFTSEDMTRFYQIPAKLIRWLNDKSTMDQYIDRQFMPNRLGFYENGQAFIEACAKFSLPFVVKASSSSAGDGVFICLTDDDLQEAIKQLQNIGTTILIEQYIQVKQNYGIHFGIPHNPEQPIEMLGVNEQLTTQYGEFIGGVIRSTQCPKRLLGITDYIRDEVLPKIRDMGWYGIGCFDVLSDAEGQLYFIDSNFRMTGMSAYHFLVANQTIVTPMMGFSGSFKGSRQDLEHCLLPYAGRQSTKKILQLIALRREGDAWNFNAALFFENEHRLKDYVRILQKIGIKSPALQQLA